MLPGGRWGRFALRLAGSAAVLALVLHLVGTDRALDGLRRLRPLLPPPAWRGWDALRAGPGILHTLGKVGHAVAEPVPAQSLWEWNSVWSAMICVRHSGQSVPISSAAAELIRGLCKTETCQTWSSSTCSWSLTFKIETKPGRIPFTRTGDFGGTVKTMNDCKPCSTTSSVARRAPTCRSILSPSARDVI